MNVINAHSGRQHLAVGDCESTIARSTWPLEDAYFVIRKIEPGIWRAWITLEIHETTCYQRRGGKGNHVRTVRMPLTVRWLHPRHPFQHVAFIET